MAKEKSVHILGREISKTQFDIYGIYDSFDKAEREIKLDYYGGSIPRDDSEYKSKYKIRLCKNGNMDFLLDKSLMYTIKQVPLNRSTYCNNQIPIENANINIKEQKQVIQKVYKDTESKTKKNLDDSSVTKTIMKELKSIQSRLLKLESINTKPRKKKEVIK